LSFPFGESGPPSNTLYLRPIRVIVPNGISIGVAGFVWIPTPILYNALSVGKKPPKIALPLVFRHPAGRGRSHGDRQHAQNMLADRQTQTHTQTYWLQYFATTPANEVTNANN